MRLSFEGAVLADSSGAMMESAERAVFCGLVDGERCGAGGVRVVMSADECAATALYLNAQGSVSVGSRL